jgi:hypothetical protein
MKKKKTGSNKNIFTFQLDKNYKTGVWNPLSNKQSSEEMVNMLFSAAQINASVGEEQKKAIIKKIDSFRKKYPKKELNLSTLVKLLELKDSRNPNKKEKWGKLPLRGLLTPADIYENSFPVPSRVYDSFLLNLTKKRQNKKQINTGGSNEKENR